MELSAWLFYFIGGGYGRNVIELILTEMMAFGILFYPIISFASQIFFLFITIYRITLGALKEEF